MMLTLKTYIYILFKKTIHVWHDVMLMMIVDDRLAKNDHIKILTKDAKDIFHLNYSQLNTLQLNIAN